jgi:hypothetical protein
VISDSQSVPSRGHPVGAGACQGSELCRHTSTDSRDITVCVFPGHYMVSEQGLTHVSIYRWAQQFTPLLIDAARPIGSGDPPAASRGRSTPTRSLDGRNTFIAATECNRLSRLSVLSLYTPPHDPNQPPMQPTTLLRQRPSRSPSLGPGSSWFRASTRPPWRTRCRWGPGQCSSR